jgi:cobalamin transport system substrate-binding protein
MNRFTLCILYIICLLFYACSKEKNHEGILQDSLAMSLKYAEGFTVTRIGAVKRVTITYPYQGATSGRTYLLVREGQTVPAKIAAATVIRIPVKSIVCTSTTHIPMLDYLGETEKLVGFPTLDYISSPKMRKRIDEGKVRELGVDKGMNIELLAALKPDMLMGYSLSGDYGQFKKIEELGIPVVLNAEYLEKHPLGRAEWIKFVALFFGKEKVADSIFNRIERDYLNTKALAGTATDHPTVVSGIVYGDAWFLPGGRNYAARLFTDAGCRYLWEDDPSHGFLQLTFESVYEKAHAADLWIGVGTYSSLDEIRDADQRYTAFKAFKTKNVYTYNARMGAKGGNEYLELGYLRPDIILKDLVKIAHPNLMPSYHLFFHKKLE